MAERVLVIDDSKEIRDFLAEYILEPKGFQVLNAEDGLMGLEMAVSERPDLMITDQQMPHMTGLEVLQRLKEMQINVPAILMTGRGSEETAVKAFRLGIRDYIIKPLDAAELSAAIDHALRESRLEHERDRLVDQLMDSNSQLQRRAQELNELYEVGKSVASSLNLEEVLQRVVEAAVHVVGAEEGSLMLLDEDRNELYIRASKNLDSEARSTRRRVTDSLAGQVLQRKEAIAIGNDSPQERIHTALLVKSLIYVPLVLEGEAIGVLGVMNYQYENSFASDDIRALSALADYATIAIQNANMFKKTEHERNLLGAVVNQNRDPVLMIDREQRVLLLNRAAQHYFNQENNHVVGQPVSAVIASPELRAFVLAHDEGERIREAEFAGINGQHVMARVIDVEGGSRYIRLRRLVN